MKALMDYAREDDDIYFWRLDRIVRSTIDVLNTVNDFTSRGVRLHSIMDQLDRASVQGKVQVAIMATLAEYERELINERVRAGVIFSAEARVTFGPPRCSYHSQVSGLAWVTIRFCSSTLLLVSRRIY